MVNKTVTAGDVLVFIPNIIGYMRVALTLISIILMICFPERWDVAIICYVASFAGDLFDGMAARKFNQTSTFGGLLDMVTDRCSTAGLLCVLSREYADEPTLVLLFTMLIILDISSHWCQMYSTISLRQHHKSADGNKGRFFLVRWYYLSYPFFGYCCVGAEFTYVALYILARVNALGGGGHEYETIKSCVEYFLMASVPACSVKQVVNVSQLCSSCYAVAEHDAKQKNKQS
ncbi:hypothetical protein ACHAXR_008413 [Thalassiosira sp. AJA248-18]